jgi:hypothetical protein
MSTNTHDIKEHTWDFGAANWQLFLLLLIAEYKKEYEAVMAEVCSACSSSRCAIPHHWDVPHERHRVLLATLTENKKKQSYLLLSDRNRDSNEKVVSKYSHHLLFGVSC